MTAFFIYCCAEGKNGADDDAMDAYTDSNGAPCTNGNTENGTASGNITEYGTEDSELISDSTSDGGKGSMTSDKDTTESDVAETTDDDTTDGEDTEAPYTETAETENIEPDITEPDTDDAETAEEPPMLPAENASASEIVASMTLEQKIYQMFIVTHEQLVGKKLVTKTEKSSQTALENYPVGGVIYFASNIVSPKQCKSMISKLQSYSGIPLFIAVDEEGGAVSRIASNSAMGMTVFPNMSEITAENEAYNVGYTIGSEIKQFGFNLDFAPVSDVNSNPLNTVIGQRAFGSDPEEVGKLVAACVKGFKDSGMLCTLKHFPGHGDTVSDSHEGYTEITKTISELEKTELVPFEAGVKAGAEFVMMGHLSVPQVTGNRLPATLSKTLIDLLKNKIGFDGLVITDAMAMRAVIDHYSSSEAAVMAVKAGIDVILMPQDLQEAAEGIIRAVENREIDESRIDESVIKIIQTKIDSGIIN